MTDQPSTSSSRFIGSISGVAALGGLLFGFDTAIISGAIPALKTYFNLDGLSLGWAVSSILIGCALGALVSGKLADHFGRKAMMLVCAVLFALSGLGAGFAGHLPAFVLFRILGGLGVGAAAMLCPMYIAEIAPPKVRGQLVSFYQLAIVSGILLAYCCNFYFAGFGENGWRWMFASQAVPALLFAGLLLLVPDTPRWLVSKGKHAQALAVLKKTVGEHQAQTVVLAIMESFSKQAAASVWAVFEKSYRKVLIAGILIAVFQQVTGINAVLYYAPELFARTGLDVASSLLQTIGIGVVNVLATFIAIFLVDKLGRKSFLIAGSLVMGLSLLGLAACFHFNYFPGDLVMALVLVYVAAFGCTLGAVTWVYLSEIFPNAIRATAMSVATLALWLADFIVTLLFPVMSTELGTAVTLIVYAGFCLLCLLYVSFRVPETRGKSLEEIENNFIKK